MTAASNLVIEDTVIANVPENGVFIDGLGTLKVANTTLRNNGQYAIALGDGVTATIASTRMLGNVSGGISAYGVTGTTTASIDRSIISGGEYGINAYGITWFGGTSFVSVTRSTIERTTSAMSVSFLGHVNIGSSLIVDNTNAWQVSSGVILSLGNNQISGNGGSVGVLSPLALQ